MSVKDQKITNYGLDPQNALARNNLRTTIINTRCKNYETSHRNYHTKAVPSLIRRQLMGNNSRRRITTRMEK